MKSTLKFFAVTAAAVASFQTAAIAAPAAAEPVSDAMPARVTEIKALVAPAGRPGGGVGLAYASMKLTAQVFFCRGVAPDQFVVKVKQYRDYQSFEIRDAHRAECRGLPTLQTVELNVGRVPAYKKVVIKNAYLIDYGSGPR